MNRRKLLVALGLGALAPFPIRAQPPRKSPRIAVVFAATRSPVQARFEAFRQGMRELGYVEGSNIITEGRYADNQADRLRAILAELVHLKVNVIVSGGSAVTRAAKDATSSIPIVMAQDADPVGTGIVASLARPGGNVTGMTTISAQIIEKQLELLKEVAPGLSRVAVIASSFQAYNAQALENAKRAAAVLRVQIQHLDVQEPKDVEAALQAASKWRADALLTVPSFVILSHRARIVEFANQNRLPSLFPQIDYVDAGGLMAYGTSITDVFRRAATYVDKILKGAKPADLPVAQPTKFELVINMKTARAIGLSIPQNLLFRADRVIE